MHSTNGTPPAHLPEGRMALLPDGPPSGSDTERLILAGYDELRRRDTLGQHDKWHWKLMAMGLLVYCGLSTAAALWFGLRAHPIHAPVQLVQVNAQGAPEPLGPPQELLAYIPSDAQWMQLVSDWVLKHRWKTNDLPVTAANLAWVAMHTCKPAIEDLRRWEKEEKPLEPSKRRVQVEITAVTKTDTPKTYNVFWREWVTDGMHPAVQHRVEGTFTVGRTALTRQEMVLHNRLGLCITGFNWPTRS